MAWRKWLIRLVHVIRGCVWLFSTFNPKHVQICLGMGKAKKVFDTHLWYMVLALPCIGLHGPGANSPCGLHKKQPYNYKERKLFFCSDWRALFLYLTLIFEVVLVSSNMEARFVNEWTIPVFVFRFIPNKTASFSYYRIHFQIIV